MPATQESKNVQQPIVIPPLTQEEEGSLILLATTPVTVLHFTNFFSFILDQVVLARITNEERPLKRVIKKFHSYTSVAHKPVVPLQLPSGHDLTSAIEDAREAFLVELASFELLLKKSALICEAEARQVEEYQREKEKIGE
jgi:THO complex subunit 7